MKTVVFDIETVPNEAACASAGVDPTEGFPPWPLHQLMCVSLLTHSQRFGEHEFSIETFSRADHGERAIIAEVEHLFEEADRVVSYNGRGFDIPVLVARAAATGERVPSLLRASQRVHAGYHIDLLDVVTNGGAAVRPRLVDLCAGWGIPAKLDMAGSSVAALAQEGAFRRIADYCEGDVVSTWLCMQMWDAGHDPERSFDSWSALAEWIRREQPRLAHLLAYCAQLSLDGGRALDQRSIGAIRL